MSSAAIQRLVPIPRRESRAIPTVTTAVPTIGKIRYLPHREINCPLRMDVTSKPSINGVNWRPDLVGLTPLTICR
jgi:hypothetical protein